MDYTKINKVILYRRDGNAYDIPHDPSSSSDVYTMCKKQKSFREAKLLSNGGLGGNGDDSFQVKKRFLYSLILTALVQSQIFEVVHDRH